MDRARLANALTSSRFVLSPLFAVFFSIANNRPSFALVAVSTCWILLVLIELTDVLDGAVARSANAVTDIGKILDPFADVVSKMTYFICLLTTGLIPLWFILVVLYREFGIILVRMLLYRDGVALGARFLGKVKTWFYALTAVWGLFAFTSLAVPDHAPWIARLFRVPAAQTVFQVVLIVTATLAVVSFVQYLSLFVRARRER